MVIFFNLFYKFNEYRKTAATDHRIFPG